MEFKPYIGLLEPRISGFKTNIIIVKLGFQYSHRVEVIGFSREIWIGWKEFVRVEIIQNNPQFTLTWILSNRWFPSVFIAFVYGSPNRMKQKSICEDLKMLIPNGLFPWMVIGDFNTILSENEKIRGLSSGKCCPLFRDFMDTLVLQDLRLKGLAFIWQRGRVLKGLIELLVMMCGLRLFLTI